MLVAALSIAPVFALIALGYGLRRGQIPSYEFWQVNDKLVYWVLMPALLFYKSSTATYDFELVKSYAVVIAGSFACAGLFALLTSYSMKMSGPVASSLLQGAARHNTFVALAIAEKLYGAEGLAIAALASAMLIPITNMTIVPGVVLLVADPKQNNVAQAVLRDLVRNPLLIAVLLGVAAKFLWSAEIPVLHDMTRILGGAALPIMLLCVGASLRLEAISQSVSPIILAIVGKMIVFPVATFLIASNLGLTEMQIMVALLFAAVPTASSSYTVARQLGGDAPLMAAIVTIQTCLSFVTLPITIMLVSANL